jgi:hypothetical protein
VGRARCTAESDIAAMEYVQGHSRDQLVAAGELIIQHDPTVDVIQNTNRRHAHSLQVTTTVARAADIPGTRALARYPRFEPGILEPAPLDTAGTVDTDVAWNMPIIPVAGIDLPLIELPTGAKWKDSTWTVSGRQFWFAPDSGPTMLGVTRA